MAAGPPERPTWKRRASDATANGFAYAVPATFTGIVGYGRGERSGAEAFQLMYTIVPAARPLVEVA